MVFYIDEFLLLASTVDVAVYAFNKIEKIVGKCNNVWITMIKKDGYIYEWMLTSVSHKKWNVSQKCHHDELSFDVLKREGNLLWRILVLKKILSIHKSFYYPIMFVSIGNYRYLLIES